MSTRTDPRIDAYIEKSAAFAQPILRRLRALVHRACPEATETVKNPRGKPRGIHGNNPKSICPLCNTR